MYERVLDKTISPTFEDLIAYSAECGILWVELDDYIRKAFSAQRQIRFPYGTEYGWSCKYSSKSKHICDIFAEKESFAFFLRISDLQLNSVYSDLSEYAQNICDNKYPCSNGGWVTYRVLARAHISDVKKLLSAKMNLK